MTKKFKLSSLLLLSIMCLTFVFFGFSAMQKHTVKADSLISFETEATIRLDTDGDSKQTTGIRFTATVSDTLYDSDEIGMIVIPEFVNQAFKSQSDETDYFAFLLEEYGADVKEVSQSISKEDLIANSGKMRGVIADIRPANFDSAYTAIAYYRVGENYTYVECGYSRKIMDLAISAVKSNESYNADEIAVLSDIIERGIAKGENAIVEEVALGKTIDLGSAITDELFGRTGSWSIKSGSDKVKLAVGGDNVQAVADGQAVLTYSALNGRVSFDVTLDCSASNKAEDIVDFVVEVESGRDIRVLQITDTQLVDSAQAQMSGLNDLFKPANFEENCFKYIRKAVQTTNPDFIIMTGDNVWGAFDDKGTSLQALIGVLDSFRIPWAAVNGNHENESEKGAQWQNDQYQFSQYGLFLRGVTEGNGNYTVGLKQEGEIKRVFCMMDTNLCSGAHNPVENHVTTSMGFTDGQVAWFNRTMQALHNADNALPISMGYHVPNYAFTQAMAQYDNQLTDTYYYTLGLDVDANEGDFGSNNVMTRNTAGNVIDYANDQVKTYGGKTLLELYKQAKVDSVFVGHVHDNSTSIVYEDIRWTFGLKSSIYDLSNRQNLGGTLITIDDGDASVTVKHVYHDETYDAYRNNLPQDATFEGMTVASMDKEIYPNIPTRMGVVKEVIGGFGAYRVDAVIQTELKINPELLKGKSSVTFSFYVPSTSTSRLSWPVSSFAIMQNGPTTEYQPYSEIGTETSSNQRNVNYNYDEWTTTTVSLFIKDKLYEKGFAWILAPGNAIYLKDISFTDLPPKSDLPVNITMTKDEVAFQDAEFVSNVKADIDKLYYVAGDTLDITEIVEKHIPKGVELDYDNSTLSITVPETGSIDFALAFFTKIAVEVEGKGDISKTCALDGIVSSFATNRENNVFNYYDEKNGETIADSKLHFWVSSNTENAIVFNSDYVKQCFAEGYTVLKIVYSVTINKNIGGAIKVSKLNGSTFTEIGDKNGSLPNPSMVDGKYETIVIDNKEVVIKIDTSSIDFDAGDKLAIGKVAAGDHNPLKITISHLEFQKPEDITKITGNIASVAVDKGIVSAVLKAKGGDGRVSVSNANRKTVMTVGRNDEGYLAFDSAFVQAQMAKGYNTIKITMSVATTVDTWGRPTIYHIRKNTDGLWSSVAQVATEQFSYITSTKQYPETCIFTIDSTLFNAIDFEAGDKLAFGHLAAGLQWNYSATISHLEFVDKWSTVDFTQNLVTSYTESLNIGGKEDDSVHSGTTTNNLFAQAKELSGGEGDYATRIFKNGDEIAMFGSGHSSMKLYVNKDYVANAVKNGYTQIKIVISSGTFDGRKLTFGHVNSLDFAASMTNFETVSNPLGTYTYDLSNVGDGDYFVIYMPAANGNFQKHFFSEISFAKPAQA